MNIVYTFDDAYAEITGVSMVSLFENNKSVKEIIVYVVDCGITVENHRKLNKIANDYKRELIFLPAIDIFERIGFQPQTGPWSSVCYVRLFYSEILPVCIDRVLHIDCDTIIRADLSDAYETEMDTCYCAGCYDCSPKPKKQANLKDSLPYISNAIILINLKKWRDESIGDKFVQYIKECNGNHPHLDQDVINAVINDSKKILPAEYNMMPITLMYDKLCCDLFLGQPYYTPQEIMTAVKNPKMIHFVGCRYTRRPWEQPCNHWYNSEWVRYYNLLDYSHTQKLLIEKKRKWIHLKQFVDFFFIYGSDVPVLKNILFWLDRKFLYKI